MEVEITEANGQQYVALVNAGKLRPEAFRMAEEAEVGGNEEGSER